MLDLPVVTMVATRFGLDPNLVAAFVLTESSGNQTAVRFEPEYKYLCNPLAWAVRCGIPEEEEVRAQKTSWGLMQVMGGVAREQGFSRRLENLRDPQAGLTAGCTLLAKLLKRYGNIEDAAAAYNAGEPVKLLPSNQYKNQQYVDKVLANLKLMRARA